MSAPTEKFELIPFLRGVRMTKAEIADTFGKTLTAIDGMVRRGMPHERTGGVRSPLRFDSAQVFAWMAIDQARREYGETAAHLVRLECEKNALFAEMMRWKEKSRC